MKALLKHNRQSPRKVRLVADMVRGKKVEEAFSLLKFTPKKATESIEKVLRSAVANAKDSAGKAEEDLYIKEITVDKGFTMKRFIPKWRGIAHPIRKHTSRISIELEEISNKKGKMKNKKVSSKTSKK